MNIDTRIVRDYLTSLKEDNELDYIFPLLLTAMNFRIVTTPRNSKGQSQYGKDVVAIGADENGVRHRWYFELKGNAAKDINDTTFMAPDGVRESLLAAKDTPYKTPWIPSFDKLPVKIVFVHNGILQENTKPQFDGFIDREFKQDEFERWGIDELTNLITKYLFNECLFRDEECYKLIKKSLVLLDAPGWSTLDIERVVDIQLSTCTKNKQNKRIVSNVFSALALLMEMIHHYSAEINNLLPAKNASDVILLQVWSWIISNHYEKRSYIVQQFNTLVCRHIQIYKEYFLKLLPVAQVYKGLYVPRGGEAEKLFYSMRCYDFLASLLYFITVTLAYTPRKLHETIVKNQRDELIRLIENNSGFDMPLLDTQMIPLQMLVEFMLTGIDHTEKEEIFVWQLIERITYNLILRYNSNKMWPELRGDRVALVKSMYKKHYNYQDTSSIYLTHLIEIIALIGNEPLYKMLRDKIVESKVNLQCAYPIENDDLEVHLFTHRLMNEMSVEINIQLPETIDEFNKQFKIRYKHIPLRTDNTNFFFMRLLAHVHYETDLFPDYLNLGHLMPM